MLKKVMMATISLSVFGMFNNANAVEIKPYVSGNIQYVFGNASDAKYADPADTQFNSKTTFDSGVGYGISGGAIINNNYRAEIELLAQVADVKKNDSVSVTPGNSRADAIMANGFYDFKNSSSFTPYIGAGVGSARITVKNSQVDDSNAVFAYQAMCGLGYDINKQNTVSVGYRYLGTNSSSYTDFGGSRFKAPYNANSVEANYRYSF